ncbi:hypothetical protein CDAR_262091 [Caerostris darwini]|uniref:Uncharacterized protein n=1 Tax=Caerostris darwini TaxID=1538125 RepID=A0AAV4RAS0_9ARAC|nr:hypothetical protein CDAR_262091 [Caerostris darwini]
MYLLKSYNKYLTKKFYSVTDSATISPLSKNLSRPTKTGTFSFYLPRKRRKLCAKKGLVSFKVADETSGAGEPDSQELYHVLNNGHSCCHGNDLLNFTERIPNRIWTSFEIRREKKKRSTDVVITLRCSTLFLAFVTDALRIYCSRGCSRHRYYMKYLLSSSLMQIVPRMLNMRSLLNLKYTKEKNISRPTKTGTFFLSAKKEKKTLCAKKKGLVSLKPADETCGAVEPDSQELYHVLNNGHSCCHGNDPLNSIERIPNGIWTSFEIKREKNRSTDVVITLSCSTWSLSL